MNNDRTMIYLAYFYKPNSLPLDGWRERLTLACHPDGGLISSVAYEEVRRDRDWVYIGFYPLGKAPVNLWGVAKDK